MDLSNTIWAVKMPGDHPVTFQNQRMVQLHIDTSKRILMMIVNNDDDVELSN